ncbi:hypothetical protein VPH35_007982 [Triticum aestivum]
MCTYTGKKDDPLRHNPNDLPADVINDMTKSVLNESLADCGKVGLSPFCKANPAPAAGDKFWKVKYDHEAAKKARKAKRAARKEAAKKKGKKATTSDLLRLEDSSESEEDTGASHSKDEEIHESRRQTRTSKDAELSSGLPNTPRKRRNEETSPSSDDSMQSNLPAFKTAPGGKAKPSQRVKKTNPTEEPILNEPKLETDAPETSTHEPPPEPVEDTPTPTADPAAEQAADGSENPEAPSLVWTDDPQDRDVEITKTSFAEPGRPTILAKCSANEELLERCRVKLDVADYTHMSIGEVFSGYMSQVHSSRDIEIDMVKQMHPKFEATTSQLESEISDPKNRL